MNQHIKSLTSLRGVAALLVLIHHLFGYLLPSLGSTISSYSKFFSNGYLWVDFFFILSGFIMTHVYASNFASGINWYNYRAYLFSRFSRIYPLHIFILFLFIGVELAKGSFAFTGKYNLTALFTNIFLLQFLDLSSPPLFGGMTYWNEPAWSISAEWITYLILPFLLLVLLKTSKIVDSVVYVSALACLFILMKLTYGNLNFIGLPSLVRCLLEGVLGIITYKIYRQGILQNYLSLDVSSILSLTGIFIVMHYNKNNIIILPFFCLLILSASVNYRGLVAKILNSTLMLYLGVISYSIYMVHWFIQELIQLVWRTIFYVDFGSGFNSYELLVSTILYILVVLLTASLTYRFIEAPMRKRLKVTAFARKYIYDEAKSLQSS